LAGLLLVLLWLAWYGSGDTWLGGPRARVADLIDALRDQGAAAIGLDMVFPEAERDPAGELCQWLQQRGGLGSELAGTLSMLGLVGGEARLAASQADSPAVPSYCRSRCR